MSGATPFILATAIAFGIQSNSGAFIDSISQKASVEVAELLNSDGEVGYAQPYKNMSKGTVKGHGSVSVVPGVGDAGVGASSGLTIITEFGNEESNVAYTAWEYSYTVYPVAQSS